MDPIQKRKERVAAMVGDSKFIKFNADINEIRGETKIGSHLISFILFIY